MHYEDGNLRDVSLAFVQSGVVTVSGALDREMTSEYQLLVIASDSASNPGNIQQVTKEKCCDNFSTYNKDLARFLAGAVYGRPL